MNAITPRRQSFGRYDRITISKATYRYVRWEDSPDGGGHILQLCVDGLLEDTFQRLTNEKVAKLQRQGNFKVDHAYFSKALEELRMRGAASSLLALSEEKARTIRWKAEWCARFHLARVSPNSAFRPKMTHADIAFFIENEKDAMNRWYTRRFGEPRPLGRPVRSGWGHEGKQKKERKLFDYPSPSTLRNWLRLLEKSGNRPEALAPRYHRCGNRAQMDSELSHVIQDCIQGFASERRPTRKDIHDQVEIALKHYNARHRNRPPAKVSQTTVNRRIALLDPFFVDVGRLGRDRAMRKYMLVGKGVEVDLPLQRVEIDDWEADLHTLLAPMEVWEKLSKKDRAAIARVRCTVTVAIDCLTRCIVGLNVSETTPTTPASKAALKSILEDKTALATFANAESDWPMLGRPDTIVTDGGPVFSGEFVEAATAVGIDASRPDPDPRKRGTIESFFRYLRRACRHFDGQTFSNVVQKADYDSEAKATLTVEEFRKAIIKFIVDVYHHRQHIGLNRATPYSMWERFAGRYPPAMATTAQTRAAFGFKHPGVRLDNQGVLYLGISYVSEGLGELLMKMGHGSKVDLVINPDSLGDVFVQVPARWVEYMQSMVPGEMHGEFLLVPAADSRFIDVTLVERLLANKAVRDFVAKAKERGDTIRINANEALSALGQKAAKRANQLTHLMTQEVYEKVVASYRVAATHSTGRPIIDDEPGGEDEPNHMDEMGLGETIATSRQTRPVVSPSQHSTQPGASAPLPTQPAPPYTPAIDPNAPKPSRSVNQGDDE